MGRFVLGFWLCCSLVIPLTGYSQTNNPNLLRFSAKVVEEDVLLSWRTAGGFTCQDMQIEVATDTTDFEVFDVFPGICGDTEPKSYTMVIRNLPLNQNLQIRLNLGNGGYSDTIQVRIKRANQVITLIPNPASNQFLITSNLQNVTHIKVISSTGKLVYSSEIRGENEFNINSSGFFPGLYYVVLMDESGRMASSPLVISH